MGIMNSKKRIMTILNHKRPDRIGRFDNFFKGFQGKCIKRLKLTSASDLLEYFNIDMQIITADESPFPTKAKIISEDKNKKIVLDGWGRTIEIHKGAFFHKELKHAVNDHADLNKLKFDSPSLDLRYGDAFNHEHTKNSKKCIFCKVGGPYQRTSFLRDELNYLMDIAGDPGFIKDLVEKVSDHIIEIGKESLKRSSLYDTGIWIFDDMANNDATMMSPKSFEEIYYPVWRKMIKSFKEAGASKVCMHGDGNLLPVLDMLVDAGIDAINPVEPRAHMNLVDLKNKYGNRLAYIGGMCNTNILRNGTRSEIEKSSREIIDVGKEGGVVIGTHSLSPDIPIENYLFYDEIVKKYGNYE